MNKKLNPCPFCGGEAEAGCDLGACDIVCLKCGASSDSFEECDFIYTQNTAKEAAIAAWNRRADVCDAKEYVEDCEECGFCDETGWTQIRQGEWKHINGDEWCCSECGDVVTTEGSWEVAGANFCSNCGADMRERKEQ